MNRCAEDYEVIIDSLIDKIKGLEATQRQLEDQLQKQIAINESSHFETVLNQLIPHGFILAYFQQENVDSFLTRLTDAIGLNIATKLEKYMFFINESGIGHDEQANLREKMQLKVAKALSNTPPRF